MDFTRSKNVQTTYVLVCCSGRLNLAVSISECFQNFGTHTWADEGLILIQNFGWPGFAVGHIGVNHSEVLYILQRK